MTRNIPSRSINYLLLLLFLLFIIPNITSLTPKPINSSKRPHYIKAKSMIRFNIEIINKTHPFYTDICFPFSTISNTDISLPLRDQLYYTDPSQYYCDEGCSFVYLDFTKGDSICDCSANAVIDNNASSHPWPTPDNSYKGITFFDVFSFTNVNLIKCYSLALSLDMFFYNLGYWLIFILLLIELMVFAVFIKNEFNPLMNYLSVWYEKVLNQKKVIVTNTNNNANANANANANSTIKIHSKNNCPIHNQQHNELNDVFKAEPQSSCRLHLIPDPDSNNNNSDSQRGTLTLQSIKSNRKDKAKGQPILTSKPKPKPNAKVQVKSRDKYDTPQSIKKHSLFKHINQTKTEELNNLEFSQAIIFDKRTYYKHYLSILLSYHPIISTFFANNNKRIQTIKISAFFLWITMLLIFNALFFSENYIDNSYYTNGSYNFIYHFPKSIVAYLFTVILFPIYDIFAYYDSGIREIKHMNSPTSIVIKIRKFIKWYKIKAYLYFGLQFASMLIGWYYVTVFCSVYRNNQVHLLVSFLVSFAIGMVMPFGTSAIVACMRYYSIKKKWQCLHKYSMILI